MRNVIGKLGAVSLALLLVGAGCFGRTDSGTSGDTGTSGGSVSRGGGACDNAYFPVAAGTTLNYDTTFSGQAGSYSLEVVERTATSLKLRYTFAVASAPSGSLSFTQDIRCDGGSLVALSYADIGSALSGGRITAETTRSDGVLMPRTLTVGTTWESSFDITATINLGGTLGSRTVDSTIANESRVVGRERVTVPAGTYDAFKVESTLTTTSSGFGGVAIPPQTIVSTSWFVEGLGMVKSTSEGASTELRSVER